MKRNIFTILAFLLATQIYCQQASEKTTFNLGFENVPTGQTLPEGWVIRGGGFKIEADSQVKRTGNYSLSITPAENRGSNPFGMVTYAIVGGYSGKEVEFRGYLKLQDVKDGNASMILRIDGSGGPLMMQDIMDKNLQGTSDWTQYSLKMPYPEEAKTIYIGFMLNGSGTVWADDFEVLIDGKDISTLETQASALKADQDKEFDNGSGIARIDFAGNKLQDLKTLGLVWGFVKYYHPAVARGDYNWDYELFRILPKVQTAKSATERDKIIYSWIESMGAIEEAAASSVPTENVKMMPDLTWIENSGLSKDLSTLLLKVKNAKREPKHYYMAGSPFANNPMFNNEKPYETMTGSDAGFRLLTLYKYWNMIQYYFPYKYLIGEDWKTVLGEFIPKFANAANDREYALATLEIVGRIHDTHANIFGYKVLDEYMGTRISPYKLRYIEDKIVVSNYFDKDKCAQSGLMIGDIITKVNNKTVKQLTDERLKYTPASNLSTQMRDIASNLFRTNDQTLTITYLRNNKSATQVINTYPLAEVNTRNFFPPETPFRLIDNKVAYVHGEKMNNGMVPDLLKLAANTKGMIIDMRCYPADAIAYGIGSCLLDKTTDFVRFSFPDYNNPGYFTLAPPMQMEAAEDKYKGKVVILVDESSISAAEFTSMAFRAAPKVTVVGSTTAAADGNVSFIMLPGNIKTAISGIGVYYPDGGETQRVGIVLDVVVNPTIKGIKDGRDEVLEKAVEIINGK